MVPIPAEPEAVRKRRPVSQADSRFDDEPVLVAPTRPSSASPSCRYEHAAKVWVKKRLALRAKNLPHFDPNEKMSILQRSALLKRTYSQPLKQQMHLKRSDSGKSDLRRRETKENRTKQSRANFFGIQTMETRMRQSAEFFGYDSIQVHQEATKIVKLANKIAMKSLDKGDGSQALAFLKRAESAGQLFPGLNALTYNNIACTYKRMGRLDFALESAESALACYKSGSNPARCIALADLRLNYGVVLSALRRHREALPQIRVAIKLLQRELFDDVCDDSCRSLLEAVRWSRTRHRLGIFPIALYNIAVELEILGTKFRALEAYRMALYFSKHLLGRRHSTTVTLEDRYRRYQVLLGSHRVGEMGLAWICNGNEERAASSVNRAISKADLNLIPIKITLPWCE